ncbi:cytochrome P450 [Lasiosphaeria ovina]|uniref:Cytochrome P450 n=1 Tax=Lasiosphaeria ovina TaxID=92902 RepID=A0AAE0KH43_9PEZI|nr:cytochrome P450 [Lasiosphaeria ovina]
MGDIFISVTGSIQAPSGSSVLWLIAGLLLVSNAIGRIQRWRRLRHIPGPLACGFTSMWWIWHCMTKTLHEDCKNLVETYGPVVRTGPNEVICADLDALQQMSSVRSDYRKDDWYLLARVSPDEENLLCMRDPELRKDRKRRVKPGYTGEGHESFEHGIDKAIAHWIELIDRKYVGIGKAFRPLDLSKHSHFYAFDSQGEIAYSQSHGFLDSEKELHNILKITEFLMYFILVLGNFSSIFYYVQKWPLYYLLPRDGDQSGFGVISGYTTKLIDQRLEVGSTPKRDILQSFINQGLGRDELREELSLQFFVGTDTVASAIRMTILLLTSSPQSYQRLQAEIDDAASNGLISAPIRDVEAGRLPYLQAVIRESLRLFPPSISSAFYKRVPKGGDNIHGYFLPEGTRVATGAVIYAMNKSKSIWCQDAQIFRPERWLEADGERLVLMAKTLDMTFGYGQFACPGKTIAFMQLSKVIPEVRSRVSQVRVGS